MKKICFLLLALFCTSEMLGQAGTRSGRQADEQIVRDALAQQARRDAEIANNRRVGRTWMLIGGLWVAIGVPILIVGTGDDSDRGGTTALGVMFCVGGVAMFCYGIARRNRVPRTHALNSIPLLNDPSIPVMPELVFGQTFFGQNFYGAGVSIRLN